MKAQSPHDVERIIARELMECPECGEESRTRPAEGITAQTLRRCNQCGGVFVMEVADDRIYVEGEGESESEID